MLICCKIRQNIPYSALFTHFYYIYPQFTIDSIQFFTLHLIHFVAQILVVVYIFYEQLREFDACIRHAESDCRVVLVVGNLEIELHIARMIFYESRDVGGYFFVYLVGVGDDGKLLYLLLLYRLHKLYALYLQANEVARRELLEAFADHVYRRACDEQALPYT